MLVRGSYAVSAFVLFALLASGECRQLGRAVGHDARLQPGSGKTSQEQLRGGRGRAGASEKKRRRSSLPTMENWDYADHGQSWYELGKCGEGVGQSPINITQAKPLSNEGNFL